MTCSLCGGSPDADIAARWVMIIDRDLPSQNALATNTGASRWRYKRERETWTLLLRAAKSKESIPDAKRRRRVIISRHYSGRQRLYDSANLVGGCKAAVDAMVHVGLLVDDSPHWAEIYYRQFRTDSSATVITIEELA